MQLKTRSLSFRESVSFVGAQQCTEWNIMRGDLHKLFAFLTSKTTDNHRRPRSASIACPRDPVCQGSTLPLHNGDGSLDKQAHFLISSRGQSQPVIRDKNMSASEALSRHKCKLGPILSPSAAFERRKVVNVNLDKSVIMEDFENEDTRKVWSSLQRRNIFNETSIQDGYLTTTLCSTELWVPWISQSFLSPGKLTWRLVSCRVRLHMQTDTGQSIWLHLICASVFEMKC